MFKTILLASLLVANTAFATPWTIQDGNGNWIDNPECTSQHCRDTGIPDVILPTVRNGTDSDSAVSSYKEQHYGFCCKVDGVTRWHTAFGRDPETALKQCKARAVVPECDPLLSTTIRDSDK